MRYPDWDIRLADYISAVRDDRFEWGVNDCLTFADGAIKAQRGEGICDDWTGGYTTAKGALRKYVNHAREGIEANIIDALDNRLFRLDTNLPPRGSLIAMPVDDGGVFDYALGIMVTHKAAFVTVEGLILSDVTDNCIFWGLE